MEIKLKLQENGKLHFDEFVLSEFSTTSAYSGFLAVWQQTQGHVVVF